MNLVLQLMLNKTNQEKEKNVLSTISFGAYAAQVNQLQLLNEILWRNSISLTDKRCDSSSNDLATLKFYLHLYSSTIDRINNEHDVRNLIAIAVEKQSGSRAEDIEQRLNDYFEPVEELHEAYNEISIIGEESVHEEECTLRRGRAWMILGYIQLMLFGNLDLIDPVHKVELKLKYLEEDIADCKKTIYVTTLQDRVLGISVADERIHPRLAATRNRETRLVTMRDDLSRLKAFRPRSVNFASLSRDSADFRNRIGSYTSVKKHINNLCEIASKISQQDCDPTDLTVAENISQEAEIWSLSVQRFAEQIKKKYLSAYPDVTLPLLAALAQLNHGVSMLINEIRRLVSLRRIGVADLESLMYNLTRFPTIGQQQENLLNLSNLCVSKSMRNLIGEKSGSTDAFAKMQEQFRIFKSGLHELHNHIILNRGLTRSLWRNMNELLQQIVLIWKQQQLEEEKRAAERDSLYKNRIESYGDTLTENEELALEVRKLFPTYREKDFHDIQEDSQSFDQKSATRSDETSIGGLVTEDDIREIQQIHSNIVTSFIAAKWIRNGPASRNLNSDYIGPLIQRYNTMYGMLDNVLPSLSEGLATKLYNSLNLLVASGLQANRGKSADRSSRENVEGRTRAYDFYKDCNVEEVKQCLPLCEHILSRVGQLLQEWPEHPTLRSIRCIIERIYTFSITSPVSRFLTGLELLLVKLHQWEENAHSGVSMMNHVTALKQQIVCWRKLELSCWKSCLDATYENLRSDTSRWWFFLYALIESYITRPERSNIQDDEPLTRQKLVESLERFMNESSLVEFESRLDLLLTFHCHAYYFDDSDNRNELLAVLWNIYNYYKQFVDDVNARVAALKAPIERKLKDFVKIARWNDISYWAVKETIEKTHRTLHKFVKEFQNALKQNVSSCLTVKSGSYGAEMNKGIWDSKEHHEHVMNPEDFTVSESSRSVDVEARFTSGLIARIGTLLTKARCLCKKIVLTNSYPYVREELENFIEDYMKQSACLRDMSVDRSLPKNKQKSQAKSILHQKKTTLANYFKTLTQIGISYRTGTLALKNDADTVMDFTVSPVDLSVIDQYFKLNEPDRSMLTQWKSCERYYYKSLIRLNALNAMLSTSQTDLGLQNIERCRGYSAHLMLMAHRQKTTIVQTFDRFSSLRIQISSLSETCEQDLNVLRQDRGQYCAESLKTLLITLEVGFEQLLLFLQCCPESLTDPDGAALTLDANALPIIAASQDDEVWKNANALLKENLNSVKVIARRFHVLFMPFEVLSVDHPTYTPLLSSKNFEFLEQCCATIKDLRARSRELKRLFGGLDVVHPIWENIAFLDTKMECFLNLFETLRRSTDVESGEQLEEKNAVEKRIEQYESDLEHLINTILLVIQKKYKDYINVKEDTLQKKPIEDNDNDIENEAEPKLNVKLELLERDITELKLSNICSLFYNLLLSIREFDLQSANYCTR